jgi:hypothetical protein
MAFASHTELDSENNGKASSGTWQF